MNFYRQPIIFFGVVIPMLVAVAVVAVGYVVNSKMTASFAIKQQNFRSHQKDRSDAAQIEQEIKEQRIHLERWIDQLGQETASAVGINLRNIAEKLPNKEITQTAFDPSNSKNGFGMASAQNSSSIRIGFRGTFRTLQKAFLELETRMPQLQLEELSLEPAAGSAFLLTMQVNYTAWEN